MADEPRELDPRDARDPLDPRDLQPDGRDAERFDGYLDALISGRRPSPDQVGTESEAEMARTAAELAAASSPGADPDPAFVEQLRMRMRVADQGIAAVRRPLPIREQEAGTTVGRIRITRRALLQGGIGAAAGLAAGAIGIATLGSQGGARQTIGPDRVPLIKGSGFWQPVAQVANIPDGTAVRFTTAAYSGYVVNDAGEIRALSSVCSHMGCTLYFRPDWKDFRCPCHGASFDLKGWLANGKDRWSQTGGYAGDETAYPVSLPPLVRPRVKVEDGEVYVWTAQV
jgi:nitrite reductase/ring-hydroxylating ferredoxin subunit